MVKEPVIEQPNLEPEGGQVTAADLESLIDKLNRFSDDLHPAERTLFQALIQRWAMLEAQGGATAATDQALVTLEVAGPAMGQTLLFAKPRS